MVGVFYILPIPRQYSMEKNKMKESKKLQKTSTSFIPHGPNFDKVINTNIPVRLNNNNLMNLYPKGAILVAKNDRRTFNSYLWEVTQTL